MRWIAGLLALTAFWTPATAGGRQTIWFFKRTSDHTQPVCDARFSFLEKYPAYYVDRRSTDADKVIYLTFDAGYENGNIEKILDTMKEKQVVSSFFILQNLVYKNKELLERMANEGHLICNHTAHHKDMAKATRDVFAAELAEMENVYKEGTGRELAKFYRPPEGSFTEENLQWAAELGYTTVLWSFAYADWDNGRQPDPRASVRKILDATHPGEIILLHPTSSTNAAIIGELIDAWKADGYRFETLANLK